MEDKYSILGRCFGHSSFRGGQEALIDGILAGRDVLGVMPTGGGKSICYQLPALLLPGLTMVISPLISLMKDQVAALEEAGIPAAFVNSSMTSEEFRTACGAVRSGECRILYVAPERLENEGFVAMVGSREVSLIAVDEAHCVSQWGQDFRPSYLRIAGFAASLPRRPVVAAFTATATQRVQEDILRQLALREPLRVITGFDRPNLCFEVLHPKKKLPTLLSLMEQRRGKSGIIYCATRAKVDQVAQALKEAGFPAARYHAGLEDEERRRSQEDFQYDRCPVMVATNAFGMGIDKSNVSFVIHYNMPKDLESYYQEAGRAGRDGEPADCILLFSPGDIYPAKFLISHGREQGEGGPEEASRQEQELRRLEVMIGYCKSVSCLRGYLLKYFGQPHPESCGNCGVCRSERREEDITIPAQMILSCVKRVERRLGYYVGPALILRVLRGSRSQRIVSLGLDQLTTYGLMKDKDRRLVQQYLDCLTDKGYLFIEEEHGTLRPTASADGVLFRGERVQMLTRGASRAGVAEEAPEAAGEERERPRRMSGSGRERGPARRLTPAGQASGGTAALPQEGETLIDALRRKRTQLAQEGQVPAYVIFSNATLADMAHRVPHNLEEFLQVSGVGEVKAGKYGSQFLTVIAEWEMAERKRRLGR